MYEGPKFSGLAGRRDEGLIFRGRTEPHGVALRRRSLVAAKLATVMRKERKVSRKHTVPPRAPGQTSKDVLEIHGARRRLGRRRPVRGDIPAADWAAHGRKGQGGHARARAANHAPRTKQPAVSSPTHNLAGRAIYAVACRDAARAAGVAQPGRWRRFENARYAAGGAQQPGPGAHSGGGGPVFDCGRNNASRIWHARSRRRAGREISGRLRVEALSGRSADRTTHGGGSTVPYGACRTRAPAVRRPLVHSKALGDRAGRRMRGAAPFTRRERRSWVACGGHRRDANAGGWTRAQRNGLSFQRHGGRPLVPPGQAAWTTVRRAGNRDTPDAECGARHPRCTNRRSKLARAARPLYPSAQHEKRAGLAPRGLPVQDEPRGYPRRRSRCRVRGVHVICARCPRVVQDGVAHASWKPILRRHYREMLKTE
ncbi:hypothetical protein FB451DRAFT_1172405 [Mycena latifolia]|nr:hypothetical protein FB451DRAFT_1172405 [Mycena latifolia]